MVKITDDMLDRAVRATGFNGPPEVLAAERRRMRSALEAVFEGSVVDTEVTLMRQAVLSDPRVQAVWGVPGPEDIETLEHLLRVARGALDDARAKRDESARADTTPSQPGSKDSNEGPQAGTSEG